MQAGLNVTLQSPKFWFYSHIELRVLGLSVNDGDESLRAPNGPNGPDWLLARCRHLQTVRRRTGLNTADRCSILRAGAAAQKCKVPNFIGWFTADHTRRVQILIPNPNISKNLQKPRLDSELSLRWTKVSGPFVTSTASTWNLLQTDWLRGHGVTTNLKSLYGSPNRPKRNKETHLNLR